jgi:glutathione S-transferase
VPINEVTNATVATRADVKSDNPAGYLPAFEAVGGPLSLFESMQVIVGDRAVQLPPSGG